MALVRIIGQVSPYEMLAKPSITSIKDLKGKTICIGGLLDINRVYLERIMQANGLRDGDYDITVVGNTAGRFAARCSTLFKFFWPTPSRKLIGLPSGDHRAEGQHQLPLVLARHDVKRKVSARLGR